MPARGGRRERQRQEARTTREERREKALEAKRYPIDDLELLAHLQERAAEKGEGARRDTILHYTACAFVRTCVCRLFTSCIMIVSTYLYVTLPLATAYLVMYRLRRSALLPLPLRAGGDWQWQRGRCCWCGAPPQAVHHHVHRRKGPTYPVHTPTCSYAPILGRCIGTIGRSYKLVADTACTHAFAPRLSYTGLLPVYAQRSRHRPRAPCVQASPRRPTTSPSHPPWRTARASAWPPPSTLRTS